MKIRSVFVTATVLAAAGAGVLGTTGTASAASAPSAPAAAAVSAPTAERSAAAASYASSARKATNQARTSHGKGRLKKSSCLTRYATAQATAMARSNSMFHQSLSPIQSGCKVGWVGENVAYGFADGTKVVNDGWMKSTGHRENILSKNYKRMGIAAVQSANGTWYVSQVFGKRA